MQRRTLLRAHAQPRHIVKQEAPSVQCGMVGVRVGGRKGGGIRVERRALEWREGLVNRTYLLTVTTATVTTATTTTAVVVCFEGGEGEGR